MNAEDLSYYYSSIIDELGFSNISALILHLMSCNIEDLTKTSELLPGVCIKTIYILLAYLANVSINSVTTFDSNVLSASEINNFARLQVLYNKLIVIKLTKESNINCKSVLDANLYTIPLMHLTPLLIRKFDMISNAVKNEYISSSSISVSSCVSDETLDASSSNYTTINSKSSKKCKSKTQQRLKSSNQHSTKSDSSTIINCKCDSNFTTAVGTLIINDVIAKDQLTGTASSNSEDVNGNAMLPISIVTTSTCNVNSTNDSSKTDKSHYTSLIKSLPKDKIATISLRNDSIDIIEGLISMYEDEFVSLRDKYEESLQINRMRLFIAENNLELEKDKKKS